MPSEKSIALFMTEGSSDKEYRVHLVQKGEGWVVNFQNGRRGAALRGGTKTEAPLAYEQAEKLYEKLVASKKKGGYTEAEDGRSFQDLPDGRIHSGLRLQRLDEVDCEDEAGIEAMIQSDAWVAEQKHDGERRAMIVKGSPLTVQGTNLEGIVVPLPMPAVQCLTALGQAVTLDSEDMGGHLVVFDILSENDASLQGLSYALRRTRLEELFARIAPDAPLVLNPVAWTPAAKRALFEQARAHDQEGLVFKRLDAPYQAGVNDNQVKVKFRASATCVVKAHNTGKRSVAIQVLDEAGGALIDIGNVTIPPAVDMGQLRPGALIEVKYLYAYPNGSLFQPVYKGTRPDKTVPDHKAKLKYKGAPQVVGVQEEPRAEPVLRQRTAPAG